jgi:predicted NAD/FAD-dependent oxidoreductase
MSQSTIAIIGAGMAGLACADRLKAAGYRVRLFDKARGPGGRMATRRITLPDGREIRFDHGAQYVTARDERFASLCKGLERQGVAAAYPWPVFCPSRAGVGTDAHFGACRLAGAGGMNAIPKALAHRHAVSTGRQVTALLRSPTGWRLTFADGAVESGFAAAVIAVPAEQAAQLLSGLSDTLAREAAAARTAPCWAGLFAFEGGGEPAFGAIRLDDDGALGWLARTADGQGWVAHASVAWSKLNLEMEPRAVAQGLEEAVRRVLPDVGATLAVQTHRWRFAQVEKPAGAPFALDADLALGVCGDWRLGPRVELAWRSGDLLGAAMAGA